MAIVKYKYNSESLSYDKIERGIKHYARIAAIYTSFMFLVSLITYFIYPYVFESPREKKQARELQQILAQYDILNKKIAQVETVLDDIQLRDENIYRTIFMADSIPNSIRRAGFGGVNRFV